MKRYHKKRIFWNLVIYIIIGLTFIESRAQVLPNERGVDWSIAGLRDTTTLGFNLYNASNEGFSNSGLTPNDIVLSNFLSNHTEPLILFFPAGNYLFNESITMRSNLVIRGEGADVTIFSFNQGGSGHSIKFIGSSFGTPVNLANSAIKDENTIDVVDVLGFTSGDWIHLSQDDTDLVTSSWGIGTVGQIMKIHSIQNNVLQMESEFRMNYDLNRNPNIRTFNPIKNAGIECIRFDRSDNTAPEQASIFFFNRAVNCWVKGVESVMTTFSHFEGRYCSNLSVSNSYFHDAFEYGGGGRAYGVMLHFSTNECLVYHNTFEHLRHSMIVQAGANGNVFAYNRSIDPYWDAGIFFPSNSAGDMVLHGNYPFANLFEQNDGQNIVIDNSHGANGPNNTFFRNRASLYGIFFSDNTSPDQNFIGNEIPNMSAPYNLVNYNILGSGHFIYGNNNKGTIDPAGTNQLTDQSYYFTAGIPSEIPVAYFASIGTPNALNSGTITTTVYADEENYFAGSCNSAGYLELENNLQKLIPTIYPNPSSIFIKLNLLQNYPIGYKITDGMGRIVQKGELRTDQDEIDIQQLEHGLYSLHLLDHSLRFTVH